MRKYSAILLLLIISSCISEHRNTFLSKRQASSSVKRITRSYNQYLYALSKSGIPLVIDGIDSGPHTKSMLARSIHEDKNLHYYPGTLWQQYDLDGGARWKKMAEGLNEVVQMPQIAYEPGNRELIQNSFLTPYQITGDTRYSKVLVESLNEQITASETTDKQCGSSADHTEIRVEKLLVNELLFFASRETGDPIYRDLALSQSEQIFQHHFQNNLSNDLFFGLANWNESPGPEELKDVGSNDLYRLSLSFYGFTYLYNETGDERYGTTAARLARLFKSYFEEDGQSFEDNMDLTSKALVCLAISGLSEGNELAYERTSKKIFKTLMADLDHSPDPEDPQYSFRMYYYLFKCISHR